jgi:DNA anti-recombination protein RmuC
MAVMAKSWTDERLEERFDRIDERFDGLDQRFDEVDRRFDEMDRRFEQRFGRVDADIRELRGEMNGRFDALQRLIIQMLVTLVVGFAGVIATLATQL